MDPLFSLPEEYVALRESVRALADKKIQPFAHDVDANARFPQEALDALQAAGLAAPRRDENEEEEDRHSASPRTTARSVRTLKAAMTDAEGEETSAKRPGAGTPTTAPMENEHARGSPPEGEPLEGPAGRPPERGGRASGTAESLPEGCHGARSSASCAAAVGSHRWRGRREGRR